MKSTFILIITLLTLIFFTGCDSFNNEEKDKLPKKTIIVKDKIKSSKPLKQIILTMGSWRKDDVEQINFILQKFNEKYPHIVIKFDPTAPSEYNDVIEAQLASDTAPDLFYLRSFSHSRKLFKKGYLAELNQLPGIKEMFPAHMLEAWSTNEGKVYGVPLMAVSHGIYYNSSFFKKMNLAIPDTWEKLLTLSESLKKKGIVPFANATGDAWTINGLILQNVIPGIIGGVKGRLDYYNGNRCFNDDQMVATFQAVKDIAAYVSINQKLLKYADSLQLFIQGKTPMWFGGSWDIPFFEAQNPDFEWSVFAIPPPAGKEHYVTFHPDAGIGLNQSSAYMKEAKLFLQWMTTAEFASLVVDKLPGFFPMHKEVTATKNRYARLFLDFNKKYKTDVRFVWGKIRDGNPSAYELSLQSSVDIMNNVITPKQAAERLQAGLSKWYLPATRCRK
jgi:raffinose/stachyose/melibiose transport system substrate-binding protein